MKKPHRHGLSYTAPPAVLAEQGIDALRRERFKDAVELFKQAIRAEPRPDWKVSLADAYQGRARNLASKGMFKEAAMVLENTIQTGETVRDPALYVSCLIRDRQQQKAAAYLLNHPPEQENLAALAAALLVSVPRLPDLSLAATPEQRRWHTMAMASRAALAAWCDGVPSTELDPQLNAISLRSAFRPVRLLLKTLITPMDDADRTRQVLETIPPNSPFFPLREAVAAVLLRDSVLDADIWHRLTPAQQTFVAETTGLTAAASQFLTRFGEAERGGSGALFNFLLKQNDLSRAVVRNACLNLLPQIPDRVSQFERAFGTLSLADHQRIQALAAESRGNWTAAGQFWAAAAVAMSQTGTDRASDLARGVIYRHLAELATKHGAIDAEDHFDDPIIFYLQQACAADPEHLPSHLQLIGHYREQPSPKDWHQLVEETVKRFPNDSRVLQQALDAALARKAYKQASGFARRLLQINAINPSVRRQMIELQIAYARKQMRAKRADLALKALKEAAVWERPDAPSAPLRIAQALVEGQTDPAQDHAETRLREGVALAGDGVAGWFRARLEADLMKISGNVKWVHQGLVQARETPPTSEAIMAVVAILAQPEAGENKKPIASLLLGMRSWLQQGAAIDWKPAEFQVVAETLARFGEYAVLWDYAQAARQRDPANLAGRFYDIVGRTQGKPDRLSMAEADDLASLTDAAAKREDFHMATRIGRFLEGEGSRRRRGRWGPADDDDDLDDDDMLALFSAMLSEMPKAAGANLRQRVLEIGREKAITELAGQLKASVGLELPMSMLRELCAAMVAQAMGGGGPARQGGARYGLPF